MKSVLLVFCLSLVSSSALWGVDLKPIFEHRSQGEFTYSRALGPILENKKGAENYQKAVRPFWSSEAADGYISQDFIWPLSQYRLYDNHSRFNFLLYIQNDSDITDPKSAWISWLLPIYYKGRSTTGEDYLAVWPFWGRVYDILGYDWLQMRFFPIHYSAKRNSVHTTGWFWPIYAKAEGNDEKRWRLWPFYGTFERKGIQKQKWAAWPFVHWGRSLNEKKPGSWYFVFPFYGKWNSYEVEKQTFLWPFFLRENYRNGDFKITAPWPFFEKEEKTIAGHRYHKVSLWPFWQESTFPEGNSRSVLWPLLGEWNFEVDGDWQKRRWLVPFYWKLEAGNRLEGRTEHYRRFWPFASILETRDEYTVRVLDLWPARRMPAIERNWAPFWTLYRYRETKGHVAQEILWGLWGSSVDINKKKSKMNIAFLYEQESVDEAFSFSVLKGLFARSEKEDSTSRYKLLWFINWSQD